MEAGNLGAASSHLAAFSGIPVFTSDGVLAGTLMHVLTTGEQGTLDGIVIDAVLGGGGARFVDGPDVAGFHERGVRLMLDARECSALPRPQPPSERGESAAGPAGGGLDAKLRRAWAVLAGGPGDA